MDIRKLTENEKPAAMELAWRVFLEFEAPEYSPEGVLAFRTYITDPAAVSALEVYGAFDGKVLLGVLAVRQNGTHISLFFVDPARHRQGVGKALFRRFLMDRGNGAVTVHSSPYAVEVYRRLGFCSNAPEQVSDGIRYIPMERRGE